MFFGEQYMDGWMNKMLNCMEVHIDEFIVTEQRENGLEWLLPQLNPNKGLPNIWSDSSAIYFGHKHTSMFVHYDTPFLNG